MPSMLAAVMPPITVVPMIWRATEPAPEAVQSGTQPRNQVVFSKRFAMTITCPLCALFAASERYGNESSNHS
jgi:hypothetical protein